MVFIHLSSFSSLHHFIGWLVQDYIGAHILYKIFFPPQRAYSYL